MVKDKLEQIITFLTQGLGDLGDTLEETNKAITSFQKGLVKAKRDLDNLEVVKGEEGISAKEKKKSGGLFKRKKKGPAQERAANVLFDMLSAKKGGGKSKA